ncbi:hypothetical protein QL285_046830 [Trifolium repens]|nr:hypothetical protein QL285_046830 [Trifolium repens]
MRNAIYSESSFREFHEIRFFYFFKIASYILLKTTAFFLTDIKTIAFFLTDIKTTAYMPDSKSSLRYPTIIINQYRFQRFAMLSCLNRTPSITLVHLRSIFEHHRANIEQ